MNGIEGIIRINELANPSQAPGRNRRNEAAAGSAQRQDGVQISPEAQNAAQVARLTQAANEEANAIRQERIEAARQALEQGLYRVNDVVRVVAARIGAQI